MILRLRCLGVTLIELLLADCDPADVDYGDCDDDEPGDCVTYPVGFVRDEPIPADIICPDFGYGDED